MIPPNVKMAYAFLYLANGWLLFKFFGAKSDNLNYVYLNCARCQGLSETEEEKTQILQDMM